MSNYIHEAWGALYTAGLHRQVLVTIPVKPCDHMSSKSLSKWQIRVWMPHHLELSDRQGPCNGHVDSAGTDFLFERLVNQPLHNEEPKRMRALLTEIGLSLIEEEEWKVEKDFNQTPLFDCLVLRVKRKR